ncbi:hypothetical protein R6Q59_002337 [Mikania micrantha]
MSSDQDQPIPPLLRLSPFLTDAPPSTATLLPSSTVTPPTPGNKPDKDVFSSLLPSPTSGSRPYKWFPLSPLTSPPCTSSTSPTPSS